MRDVTIISFVRHTLNDFPNLRGLLDLVPSMSLSTRKILLHFCQVGYTGEDAKPQWDKMASSLCRATVVRDGVPSRLTTSEVLDIGDLIAESTLVRSLVSMMVRCETYTADVGYEEELRNRIEKEVQCSQREKGPTGLSYSCLFQRLRDAEPYSLYYPLTPSWSQYARSFARSFATKVETSGVIFPRVQRRKNMSRETCDLLYESGYRCPLGKYNARTLDLELHKMQTGVEVQGACEMRYAWTYGHLQPRCYYCIGGTAYWQSRYHKRIAVLMMESLGPTKVQRRNNPGAIDAYLSDEDWVVIWDYETFTTDLSELKYFLYWISRFIEDMNIGGIKVLDYSSGIEHYPLHELLDTYNEVVNNGALFTVYRIADKFLQNPSDYDIHLRQKNSGMLGVQGNIGYSTAQHGFHVSPASKDHDSSCEIGDDAIAVVNEEPTRFIKHLQITGTVHEDKADILEPIRYGERQLSKFTKRRLIRTSYGISIDELYSFPNLAVVFDLPRGFHTTPHQSPDEVIMKFVTTTGKLLWDIYQEGHLEENENSLLMSLLHCCYRKLGLATRGSLPGFKHRAFKDYIPICVPPLNLDYAVEDWSEVLWSRNLKSTFRLPLDIQSDIAPFFRVGQTFECTSTKMVQVLQDIGCVKKGRLLDEICVVDEDNYRRFKAMFFTSSRGHRMEYVAVPPDWFYTLCYGDPHVNLLGFML